MSRIDHGCGLSEYVIYALFMGFKVFSSVSLVSEAGLIGTDVMNLVFYGIPFGYWDGVIGG